MKRITIKIGTAVLAQADGSLNHEVIDNLVEDVAILKKEGVQVAIISSGAINLGRSVPKLQNRYFKLEQSGNFINPDTLRDQILSAVGQPKLMAAYSVRFEKCGYDCAQVLVTRSDFANRKFYLSLRVVTEELLRLGVIPVFNENDVLSAEEINFGDNDQLAMMVSAMLNTDKLVVLTNVDGVFDCPPHDQGATRVAEILDVNQFLREYKVTGHSSVGKGGMRSKLLCADTLVSLGISMTVGSGLVKRPITRLLQSNNGTSFPVAKRKEKASKTWLITAAIPSGKIVVSTYLAETLRNKRTASVLLAGIEKVQGVFDSKKVVEICDDNGVILGRGLVLFDNEELATKMKWYRELSDEEKAQIKAVDVIVVHYNNFIFL
ncbi:MAG: glutamate 5-kinase [bacterium]